LLDSRRDALKQQYRSTMGREPPEFLSEKGQKALDRVRNWSDTGQAAPAGKGQGTSAPAAPTAAGGQQKTINGKTYTKRDGQWFED